MKAIIYDTETTGTDPDKDKVIQHAILTVEMDDGLLTADGVAHCRNFSSPVPISYGAMATHKIREDEIVGLGYFDRATHFPPCAYLIGHKVDFDWKMVGMPLEPKRICTLAIARACYPEESSHTLGAVYLLQNEGSDAAIRDLEGAHDAGEDVVLTLRILRRMIMEFCPSIRTMEDLYLWSEECRIPKRWDFGKWKGRPLSDADTGYMHWYLRQAETDPYYVKAIKQYLQIR